MDSAAKDKLLKRLSRVEGQVRGISRMVEEERYCVDILVQIAAARAALDKVGLEILRNHTKGCVSKAVRQGEGEHAVEELISVIEKFIK